MGLTPPRQGSISFQVQDIQGMMPHQIASNGIGYVPEHRAIFRDLSVEENLRIAERKKGDLAKREDFIFDLFPDLKRLIKLPGGNLSGGQQQMLAVARALVPENTLLLIDEPSEGLAPVLIEHMMEAIRRLSSHTTVLLVEQNFIMASQLADRYTIIEAGKSVRSGMMVDLVDDEETIHRYLGAA
jgi:branched-chain amino acid transport system ATP-binding protein